MSDGPTPTYHFAPQRESGALGLARAQVVALSIGVALGLLALIGARDALAGFGVVALATVVAFAPVAGRPLATWMAPLASQLGGSRGGTASPQRHLLRVGAGIVAEARPGPLHWQLPGMGRLGIRAVRTALGEVGVADLSGARRAASLTFSITGPRFGLADPDEQARALGAWGQVLAALARESRELQRLQLSERLVPDDLSSQWRYLAAAAFAETGAAAIYRAELEALCGRAVRHEVLLTVTLGGGRGHSEQLVATECQRVYDLLSGAGFGARPLSAGELAGLLRTTFDPEGATDISDHAFVDGGSAELAAAAYAPSAWRTGWGSVRTDSARHACFEASGLPRLPVGPEWAWPLVLAAAPVTRRTLALHLELARPDLAIRRAERAVVGHESDEAMRARWGFRSGARVQQAHDAALDREAELAGGYADARFSLVLAVSATSRPELSASCRALVSEAAQSHVELRRLYGRQAKALVATLPLGVVRFKGGWR